MLCALIMAGGRGERFWPMSTDKKPKQFLKLLGEDSMIQLTVKRLEPIIPIDRIFIVTASSYKELIKEHIPNIPDRNIIIEPEGRNTSACIALSTFVIQKYYGNVNMVVLPSDHLILNEDNFRRDLEFGNEFLKNKAEAVITIGISATRPDTGYGYIELEDMSSKKTISKVKSFKEKPSYEKAKEYLVTGNYLWNSGIFLWSTDRILELIKEFLPQTYNVLREIPLGEKGFDYEVLKLKYKEVDNISVDYGIMEKLKQIYVIKSSFIWDDLGSWNSLSRYKDKDKDNNTIDGSVIVLNSKDNIIQTNKKTYVMGIKNLIIVETENEIMIVNKNDMSRIKELKQYG